MNDCNFRIMSPGSIPVFLDRSNLTSGCPPFIREFDVYYSIPLKEGIDVIGDECGSMPPLYGEGECPEADNSPKVLGFHVVYFGNDC